MKKKLFICMALVLGSSFLATGVWAIDVGWMQKGVRVWYFGGVGTGFSSDAEEAFLFKTVVGDDVQVTKHSGSNHWGTTHTVNTSTYSFLDKGPCWIHPETLKNMAMGDSWMGFEITMVTRATYTYDMLPYHLLPAKALFDLKPKREIVKINYMIAYYSTGTAYFDAETGLCLFYSQLNGSATVFFILNEINYDFAGQKAFAEDDGPHTGFGSYVRERQISAAGVNMVLIQSSVETRYGNTVEMWATTTYNSYIQPDFEYYCFFGSVPVLRHVYMTDAPIYPEQWDAYGEYLWWWIPKEALEKSTINVFGVSMNRTSTDPYTFEAAEEPASFHFSKLWFGADGYMTAFSAKDSAEKLDIDPGYTASYYDNLITVYGLDYYRNIMGIAKPDNQKIDTDFPWDMFLPVFTGDK